MKKAAVIALLTITVLTYASSFPGAYHFDDYPLVLENEKVVDSEFDYSAFLEHYGGRPLTFWSFWLNYQFSGQNPSVYHGVGLLLHISVVMILFFLVLQWRKELLLAFFTALIFSIHPVQAQAVNYIWSRSMLLMALFSFSCLFMVKKHPWAALLLLQFAIWSRFEAIVLVLPLILVNSKKTLYFAGLGIINLVLFIVGIYFYHPGEFAWYHSNPIQYWLNGFAAVWWYFAHLIWPINFSIYRGAFTANSLQISLAIIGLVILSILSWKYRKSSLVPVTGIVWTILWLFPSLAVPNAEVVNESRSYVAFAGISCFLGWSIITVMKTLLSRSKLSQRMLTIISSAAILAVMVPATYQRNQIWQNSVLLWKEAVAVNPDHFHPYYNLGSANARIGEFKSAREAFQKSSELKPDDDMSYAGLGYCCEMSLNWKCAARWYKTALSLNPKNQYAAQGYSRVSQKIESEGS